MTSPERHTCRQCQSEHELHRHRLESIDKSSLACPVCGDVLIAWHGHEFLTYGRQVSTDASQSSASEQGETDRIRQGSVVPDKDRPL